MSRLLTNLREALGLHEGFPPKKKGKSAKKPVKKSKSTFGKKKPKKESAPFGGNDSGDDASAEAMMQMQLDQQAQQQELQAKKEAAEAKERKKTKKIKSDAEAEVMDDLLDKYLDRDDKVKFYPTLEHFRKWGLVLEGSSARDSIEASELKSVFPIGKLPPQSFNSQQLPHPHECQYTGILNLIMVDDIPCKNRGAGSQGWNVLTYADRLGKELTVFND